MMEVNIDVENHDRFVRAFITVQDLGVKGLIRISKAKITIEGCSRLISIAIPKVWSGAAIALTRIKHSISTPRELEGFEIEIVLAE